MENAGTDPALTQYCVLPVGWDTGWKAAKAARGSRPVGVVGIGDEILAGKGATDIMADSCWATLRASLTARDGGVCCGDYFSFLYDANVGLAPAVPPIVLAGVTSTDWNASYGGFGYCIGQAAKANSPLVSCTPPYAVVGFDILYVDYATGSWTYKIDGGVAHTVTCTGAGTIAGSSVKKVSITGLTAGTHTLTINATGTTAAACSILGVTAYAATTGLAFANMAWAGMGLYTGSAPHNALSDTGAAPVDKRSLYQGYSGTTASPTALTGLSFPAQPDLAIVALGMNDALQSVTKGNFRDALLSLVYALRYGTGDVGSVLIVAPYVADGQLAAATAVTDQDYTAAASTAYRDIKAAMLEVAQSCCCGFVDVQRLFGRTPYTNGWITSATDGSPTPAGHLKMAVLLNGVL